jgi:hypothetical protein
LHPAPRIFDGPVRAVIHAGTAEDTFVVLHRTGLNHRRKFKIALKLLYNYNDKTLKDSAYG